MAISVNWVTGRIFIPRSDLTLISGTFYRYDTSLFRLELIDLEDDVDGRPWPRTHTHNTLVVIAGSTRVRDIIMSPYYTIEFENGAYSVELIGSNNDMWSIGDGILIQNTVQVIPTNTFGYVQGEGGASGGLTPGQEATLNSIETIVTATQIVVNAIKAIVDWLFKSDVADEVKSSDGTVTKYEEGTNIVHGDPKQFTQDCETGDASLIKK